MKYKLNMERIEVIEAIKKALLMQESLQTMLNGLQKMHQGLKRIFFIKP